MEPIQPQTEISDQPDQPVIFCYRPLKTGLFFAAIWLIMALFSLYLIRHLMLSLRSLEALTLMLAAFGCGVMAFHSLEQYGGPFLSLYKDHLIIHYSQMRKVTVPFAQIKALNVVKEDLEILLQDKTEIFVNLSHLSFADQDRFLTTLQDTLPLPLNG